MYVYTRKRGQLSLPPVPGFRTPTATYAKCERPRRQSRSVSRLRPAERTCRVVTWYTPLLASRGRDRQVAPFSLAPCKGKRIVTDPNGATQAPPRRLFEMGSRYRFSRQTPDDRPSRPVWPPRSACPVFRAPARSEIPPDCRFSWISRHHGIRPRWIAHRAASPSRSSK